MLSAAVDAINVFLKSFIIVSTHRRRHVLNETGFERDSPNPNLDLYSLTECSFFTESIFGFTMYPNPDSLIEYPLSKHVTTTQMCVDVHDVETGVVQRRTNDDGTDGDTDNSRQDRKMPDRSTCSK